MFRQSIIKWFRENGMIKKLFSVSLLVLPLFANTAFANNSTLAEDIISVDIFECEDVDALEKENLPLINCVNLITLEEDAVKERYPLPNGSTFSGHNPYKDYFSSSLHLRSGAWGNSWRSGNSAQSHGREANYATKQRQYGLNGNYNNNHYRRSNNWNNGFDNAFSSGFGGGRGIYESSQVIIETPADEDDGEGEGNDVDNGSGLVSFNGLIKEGFVGNGRLGVGSASDGSQSEDVVLEVDESDLPLEASQSGFLANNSQGVPIVSANQTVHSVSEPATFGIFGLGAVLMLMLSRKRKA